MIKDICTSSACTMNLSLVDPFILAQDYPDALTGKLSMLNDTSYWPCVLTCTRLESGRATCIRFNRKGDFLASGRVRAAPPQDLLRRIGNFLQLDGTIVVFDTETNGVAHKLRGHTRQIQSLRYRPTKSSRRGCGDIS